MFNSRNLLDESQYKEYEETFLRELELNFSDCVIVHLNEAPPSGMGV